MLTIVDDGVNKQCALIIDNKLLLGPGIEHLLPAEACSYIVGVVSPNGATLLKIIKQLQPDMVILDETYFLTLSLGRLIELLDNPQLCIVTVSANDDRVKVYYKQQLRITRAADLVHFIRGSKKMVTGHAVFTSALQSNG
jgi:hypothetical protein